MTDMKDIIGQESGHDECPACGFGRCPATRGEPRPPGCLATLPIAVLAGTRREFDDFVRERGLSERQAVYIGEPHHAHGAHFRAVEHVGSWRLNSDSDKLERLVMSRVRE